MISYQWLDFQLVVENFNWLSLKVVKVGNGLKVISLHIYAIRTTKKHCVVNIKDVKILSIWAKIGPKTSVLVSRTGQIQGLLYEHLRDSMIHSFIHS